jgi:hypothetical protein
MATYSNNTTLKISGTAVGSANRVVAGTSTVYTAPANSYAIVTVCVQGAMTSMTIGGVSVAVSGFTGSLTGVVIGPGHALAFSTTTTTSTTVSCAGVVLTNSP